MAEHTPTLAALNIGNTNLAFGLIESGKITSSQAMPAGEIDGLLRLLSEHSIDALALASANAESATRITDAILNTTDTKVLVVGRDLPIPMSHSLSDEAIARTGHDRLLAAYGAYQLASQACVIVDAGTAVTVDFVDGEGVFHGGAIAPGAAMQLRALAEWTDALPLLAPEKPVGRTIGIDTDSAMQRGVHSGIRGLVRLLVEQYAEEYEGYPLVLATGGDAKMLFEDDELIDRIVPDLVLAGIATCCEQVLGSSAEG